MITPQEDSRLHKIEKGCQHYNFGTTAELAGNMAFLFEIIKKLQLELAAAQSKSKQH